MKKKSQVYWFDIELTYDELGGLDKMAKKYTKGNHMHLLKKLLVEAISREEKLEEVRES